MTADQLIATAASAAGLRKPARPRLADVSDRVFVRRIMSSDDADIEGMVALYTKLFPDRRNNHASGDILALANRPREFDPADRLTGENIILVARRESEVVGFLFCHFSPWRRMALVSYYGIDKRMPATRRSASVRLLGELRSWLEKGGCDYIFCEALRPGSNQAERENRERKARLVLLKHSASVVGLEAHELKLHYISPKISLAEGTREEPLALMIIPMGPTSCRSFARSEVVDFLRFIYLDCYGDIYPPGDPRYEAYRSYLETRVSEYAGSLPALVTAS